MLFLDQINTRDKRVLIRMDFNVPISKGEIINDARIRASLPTIKLALRSNAAIMLLSHLGRPTEGKYDQNLSLQPIANHLSSLLNRDVRLIREWTNGVEVKLGEVVLLENVRFQAGESKNEEEFARKIAALCDVFVMDAFGTAHRKQASTFGVIKFSPIACAGPLLRSEIDALNKVLQEPKRPIVAIVGGSKVSTKLAVLKKLSTIVDYLIVGGGIANTCIATKDINIGKSLYERKMLDTAAMLLEDRDNQAAIPLPVDVVVSDVLSRDGKAQIKAIEDIQDNELILDIGPATANNFSKIISKASTILWNGPLGVFEFEQFSEGTRAVCEAIAESNSFSVAGGGDTLAAIEKYGISDDISYISTGGGAFLEFLGGKILPSIEILQKRA